MVFVARQRDSKAAIGYERLLAIETTKRHQPSAEREGRELIHVLSEIAPYCSTTDPRDLCYAFLGFQNNPRVRVTPSYDGSIVDAYTNTSRAIIDGSGNLNILGVLNRTQSRVGVTSLPSWVPDWSGEPMTVSLYTSHNPSFCSADGGVEHRRGATQRLHVHGRVVDKIESLHGTQEFELSPLQQVSVHDIDIKNLFDLEGIFSSLLSIWPENFPELSRSRLLKAILAEGANPGDSEVILIREASGGLMDWHIEELLAAYDHWDSIRTAGNNPDEYEKMLDATALLAYSQVIKNRRVVVTKDWRPGIAPKSAQRGDCVCIINGSRTPVILRKLANGTYGVIGQAYIEGIMRGEAVPKTEETEFILS
jgi:hypothetical protein